MHSPLHHPPSATTLLPSGHSTDHHHLETPNVMHSSSNEQRVLDADAIAWPWCQSCRPLVQILLGQGTASIAGQGPTSTPAAPWALSSPFPEYVCVPALVHRSQLALFAPSVAQPPSPVLSPQEQPGLAAPSNSASVRQRKARGVKIACTNCRLANKKCDDGRPCERCKKSGLAHSCVSAERKPRKRRQTATATMTVSATQVSMERSTIPKDDTTTTTTVHIAAAGTTYVDDTQESTDAASHSSPSGSSMTAGDFDSQLDAPVLPPSYAVQTNFWSSSLQPYPTSGSGSDAQFSNWGFGAQNHTPLFGHGMSPPTPSDHHHSLSPTGLEGSSIFPFAGQQF
ncbi:hypothetical protein V8D89_010459 [Ganoderma adspersum]